MDNSLEPIVLEDTPLEGQSCQTNNSNDNNLAQESDSTKESEIIFNSSDVADILENCDSRQSLGNNEQRSTVVDDKDEVDSKSVQQDDKNPIQFQVGASDDEEETASGDTSQPLLANHTTDEKGIIENSSHDDKLLDSHDDSNALNMKNDDVSSKNENQTSDIETPPKPNSSFEQTIPTEEPNNKTNNSEHPDMGNGEPVIAHTSRDSNPTFVKPSSSIEDPEDQTIERSEKARCVPKPVVHEVPNTNILVACLVTICFNLPLGAIAIYFSLTAAKAYRDGMRKKGASRARTSMLISLLGIVLTVLAVMTLVLWMAMYKKKYKRPTTKLSLSL